MKKIIITAFLLLVFITVAEISATFSLFETKNDLLVHEDIGKWSIKVNDANVSSNTSFVVDDFVVDSSINVNSGKFYPGGVAYFDIVINPNDCDVSFRYDILVDEKNLVSDHFKILSVSEASGVELIKTGESTYSGIITLDEIKSGVYHTIRVNMIWENDEGNNYTDSLIGNGTVKVKVPIAIHLIQHFGEELGVYTG